MIRIWCAYLVGMSYNNFSCRYLFTWFIKTSFLEHEKRSPLSLKSLQFCVKEYLTKYIILSIFGEKAISQNILSGLVSIRIYYSTFKLFTQKRLMSTDEVKLFLENSDFNLSGNYPGVIWYQRSLRSCELPK